MSAETIATTLAEEQGWTDATLLDLALTYIDRQGANDAFAEYLNRVAEEENEPDGPICEDCGADGTEVSVAGRDTHGGDLLCENCADRD